MKDDTISVKNVDKAVRDAIQKYFDIGMLVDAMFWQTCIGLLQTKYEFKLEKAVTKASLPKVTARVIQGSGNREE